MHGVDVLGKMLGRFNGDPFWTGEVKLVFGALTSSHFPPVNLTCFATRVGGRPEGFNKFHY